MLHPPSHRPRRSLSAQRGRPVSLRCEALEGRTLLATVGLNPDFGQGGIVLGPVTPVPAHVGTSGTSRAAVQPDGRIVVVTGTVSLADASPKLIVQRFNADGSVDSTFGTDGTATLPVPTGRNELGTLPNLAIAPDGAIVVTAGFSEFSATTSTDPTTEESLVARLTADGQLDSTFAQGGEFLDDAPGAQLSAVVVQADGRIVAGGSTGIVPLFGATPGQQQVTLIRLTTAGTLDPTFNGTGTVDVVPKSLNTFLSDDLGGLALTSTGQIVVASDLGNPIDPLAPNPTGTLLTRINPDGTPDARFGIGGTADVSRVIGGIAGIAGIVVQPDGAVVVAGPVHLPFTPDPTGFEPQPDPSVAGLVRFLPDGAIDPTFQPAAIAAPANGPRLSTLALGSDGEFTAAGYTYVSGTAGSDGTFSPGYFATVVERYEADGTLDPNFGSGGVLTFPITPTSIAGQPETDGVFEPLSATVTPTGSILFADQVEVDAVDSQGLAAGVVGRQLALVEVLATTPPPPTTTGTGTPTPTPTPVTTTPPPAPAGPATPGPVVVVAPAPAPAPTDPATPPPSPPPSPPPTPDAPPADPAPAPVGLPLNDPGMPVGTTTDPSATPTTTNPVSLTSVDPVPTVVPVVSPSAGKALTHSHHNSHLRRPVTHTQPHPTATTPHHAVTHPAVVARLRGRAAASATSRLASAHHVALRPSKHQA